MWTDLHTSKQVADQWDVDGFMKQLLEQKLVMNAAASSGIEAMQ